MTTAQAERLHLRLPPLREPDGVFIAAWQQADGAWQRATFKSLAEIARHVQAKHTDICPHPDDLSMTDIDVPPLRARALRMAVHGAVELLALTPPDQLIIGFGERKSDGSLPVAWLSVELLQLIQTMLADAGLHMERLLPPPALLPLPAQGEASATLIDNWLVVRTGSDSGAMLPFPHGAQEAQSRVQALFPASECRWLEEREDGADWNWSLPHSRISGDNATTGWQRPAIGWLFAAALVWLGGLNLYAWNLQTQGQAIKQQMAEQVQAVFPELSVVLNPLQQARQLRDARASGNLAQEAADFPTLLRLAAGLMSNRDGQVAQVSYQAGQLAIRWREGAALRRAEAEALQQQAREKQLIVENDSAGLVIRSGPAQSEGSTP